MGDILFNRACRVELGSLVLEWPPNNQTKETGIRPFSPGLHIRFRVEKNAGLYANTLDLSVYNLSPKSRSEVEQKNLPIRLYAGYKNNSGIVAQIYQGKARRVLSSQEGASWRTRFQVADGSDQVNSTQVKFHLPKGTLYRQMAEMILSQLGLSGLEVENAKNFIKKKMQDAGVLKVDSVVQGDGKKLFTQLLKSYGLSFHTNDEQIIVYQDFKGYGEIVKVGPKTGLIGSPQLGEIDKLDTGRLEVKCLLRGELKPQGFIQIESESANGLYVVEKLIHTGDTYGQEWYSQVTCYGARSSSDVV